MWDARLMRVAWKHATFQGGMSSKYTANVGTSPEKQDACGVLGKAKNLPVVVPQLISAAGWPVELLVGLCGNSLGSRRPPHACRAHVSLCAAQHAPGRVPEELLLDCLGQAKVIEYLRAAMLEGENGSQIQHAGDDHTLLDTTNIQQGQMLPKV